MNKINNVPFYSYNVSLKANDCETKQSDCSENNCKYYSNEYMSSDISSASRAYGLSFINKNKTIPQMSLKDMIKWFEFQGKVEGKDFEIDSSCTLGNTVVMLKNKLGQEELTIHYDCGNYNTWNCYEVSEYLNGRLSKQVDRDSNGDICSILHSYDKSDVAVQHLLDEVLTYDTKPDEYIKYLEDNNVEYSVEYSGEEENNRSVHIDIFDKDKQRVKTIWYYYGRNKFDEHCQLLSLSDINKDGKEFRRIMFDKDNVEVVTYVN